MPKRHISMLSVVKNGNHRGPGVHRVSYRLRKPLSIASLNQEVLFQLYGRNVTVLRMERFAIYWPGFSSTESRWRYVGPVGLAAWHHVFYRLAEKSLPGLKCVGGLLA